MSQSVGCYKRIVVKYGGASLADAERILKAVMSVAREVKKGTQIAVVVSAMGKTTDLLLNTVKNASGGDVDKRKLDDVLAMGERTSVRIFAMVLETKSVESRYFDPLDQDWPIITDDSFSNANPVLEECEKRIQQYVLPLVERGVVPVIAGFVGRTVDGEVTTLGRGGSDTTAFILARALRANEVILVTDSDGVMSADPKIIDKPRRIPEIDVNTLVGLADSGKNFIRRKALKYKDPSINVRVINYRYGDLNMEGTLITGALSTELNVATAGSSTAASITVVGCGVSENPIIMQELIEDVKTHSSLLGLSSDRDSMILYVLQEGNPSSLLDKIHETVLKHKETVAMSVRRKLAFLKISGVIQEEMPRIIGKISENLTLNRINVFSILTITSNILLFVNWNERKLVQNLIKGSLRSG